MSHQNLERLIEYLKGNLSTIETSLIQSEYGYDLSEMGLVANDVKARQNRQLNRFRNLILSSSLPLLLAIFLGEPVLRIGFLGVCIIVVGVATFVKEDANSYNQVLALLYVITNNGYQYYEVSQWLRNELSVKYGRYSVLPKSEILNNRALLNLFYEYLIGFAHSLNLSQKTGKLALQDVAWLTKADLPSDLNDKQLKLAETLTDLMMTTTVTGP